MFDILVESSKRKSGKRAGRYFVVTTAIYSVVLLLIGIGTVISFSPALAEEFNLATMIAPPVPSAPSAPPEVKFQNTVRQDAPLDIFAPPKKVIDIPEIDKNTNFERRKPVITGYTGLPGGIENPNGCIGCKVGTDDVPPPQPPPPAPTPDLKKAEVKPAGTTKVSEGVLQGSAVKKTVPVYPPIAKAARAAGVVQVVVTISEEGRVIEAQAINGHPLLRQSAVEAAQRWLFTPTKLSNVPVKVQGVLSFNFMLQ
ncbi:MAG TPA: energy transducer TonB [Blastocatellia bacterium]|nr:energy transducer TonB [Blastocatellia bacterium]